MREQKALGSDRRKTDNELKTKAGAFWNAAALDPDGLTREKRIKGMREAGSQRARALAGARKSFRIQPGIFMVCTIAGFAVCAVLLVRWGHEGERRAGHRRARSCTAG